MIGTLHRNGTSLCLIINLNKQRWISVQWDVNVTNEDEYLAAGEFWPSLFGWQWERNKTPFQWDFVKWWVSNICWEIAILFSAFILHLLALLNIFLFTFCLFICCNNPKMSEKFVSFELRQWFTKCGKRSLPVLLHCCRAMFFFFAKAGRFIRGQENSLVCCIPEAKSVETPVFAQVLNVQRYFKIECVVDHIKKTLLQW